MTLESRSRKTMISEGFLPKYCNIGNKNLIYEVTTTAEFTLVDPWISLRKMEEDTVYMVETVSELFFKGESSKAVATYGALLSNSTLKL